MAQISVEHGTDELNLALTLTGDLDFASVLELRCEFLTLVQLAPTNVAVSLAGVSFLDCAAVGLLVEAWHCAASHGRDLTVTEPRQTTAGRVLDLLGPTLPFPVAGAHRHG
jgi:anti-anti-sigma factor